MKQRALSSRRQFLRASATAGVLVAPTLLSGKDPNDTVRLGLIGCGPRGSYDATQCLTATKTSLVAVCDVDPARIDRTLKRVGGRPEAYSDFRRILDRKDVDAVIVATPDHWHCIPTLQAIHAGKDVYLEKPVGHTIEEGQVLVEAIRQQDRVVQVGLQQRSGTLFQEACQLVQSGKIGKVTQAHCINVWNANSDPKGSRGLSIGTPPDGEPPQGVDYDLWLGPAPKRPFNPNRFHWNYIYFWDYSGGMIIGWGVHLIDIVLWALRAKGPRAVSIAGGKFLFDDMRETPDTAEAVWDFPNFILSYSCRHGNAFPSGGRRVDHGIQFLGSEATLLVDRKGYQIIPEKEKPEPVVSAEEVDPLAAQGEGTHHRAFIDCIRTRKQPPCDIVEGHRSTTTLHLANIAYRTGTRITWDPETERIVDNPKAAQLVSKQYRRPWSLS